MRQRGFTLVELVMTMIIIGILAVVALPRFDLLSGFDEIGYRDQVKATLEYARKSAVAQRRNVRVSVVDSAVTVEVHRLTPEGEGTDTWVPLNLPGSSSHQFDPPSSGTTLDPSSDTIIFYPLGSSSGAAFTVSGGAGTITVNAETGYVYHQ